MSNTITSITQMPGIFVAHATNTAGATGCTVIICPRGATGGVDVRGGAPATRETDLLRPEETVNVLHAVVLSGGSAFGLEASCGVANELAHRGIGLDVGVGVVPIVSGACLFDLACGDAKAHPTREDGAAACREALDRENPPAPLSRGCVGAGTGCTVGKLAGPHRAMKSGLGEAVAQGTNGVVCCAVAAVNAVGDIRDPYTGSWIAGMRDEKTLRPNGASYAALMNQTASMPLERTNTTISCIVTNAKLTKAQATKVAQMAADAYAHAIVPTHTTNDGDTIFVMATGEKACGVDVVGALAQNALERAIADGAQQAISAYGFTAACDL